VTRYDGSAFGGGRRFRPEDFPRTSWNLRRFLFAPRLGCHGIQRITFLREG
jgi:cholesterol oxidase